MNCSFVAFAFAAVSFAENCSFVAVALLLRCCFKLVSEGRVGLQCLGFYLVIPVYQR